MKQQVICGIDLGGTRVRLLWETEFARGVIREKTGEEFTPDHLKEFLERCREEIGVPQWDGIGIAVPGLTDGKQVTVSDVLPRFSGWHPDRKELKGDQVLLTNDADAALFCVSSALAADSVAVMLMVGTAVGAGIAIGGTKFEGGSGGAGELGYWPVPIDGEWGRLDQAAGGAAVIAASGSLSPEEIAKRALRGEEESLEAIARAGRTLGAAAGGVINFLNPTHLFYEGGTFQYPGYEEVFLKAIETTALPSHRKTCRVLRAAEKENVVLEGVLSLLKKG